MPDDILSYVHIGDLHLTTGTERNYEDLRAIVTEIETDLAGAIDFVYVPGDIADNGLPEQYDLAVRQLARLSMPVHIVTGDHDMEPGDLGDFYRSLDAAHLPFAVNAGGIRCLFLDICGPGGGGPDFRLGERQSAWLSAELGRAMSSGTRCAIFMHSYPADLKGDGETAAINEAFAAREVLLVDMGHTHYNELANDGRTIFAATRSTGQIEEGPVGYSIVAVDRRVVSWRFRPLGDQRPIVLLTAPADRRLATDAGDPDHVPRGRCEVRVSVLGPRRLVGVTCTVNDDAAVPMRRVGDRRYVAAIALAEESGTIRVEARDDLGQVGSETIEVATRAHVAAERHANGSDADTVGAWEERGLLGTQLGPNRNGKSW